MLNLKVDKIMVVKGIGIVCNVAGMLLGAYATTKTNEKHLDEFAKKHFEQMASK